MGEVIKFPASQRIERQQESESVPIASFLLPDEPSLDFTQFSTIGSGEVHPNQQYRDEIETIRREQGRK